MVTDDLVAGESRLVVVNSAKWPSDFTEHRMYCCPAGEHAFDPSYKHYPAKFIGNYVAKGTKYIGVVTACVHLRKIEPDRVLWRYGTIEEEEAIARAETVRRATQRNQRPCLVFLQEQLSATDLVYDQGGGLMGSRIYFDIKDLNPIDVKDLAVKLRGIPWSALDKFIAS